MKLSLNWAQNYANVELLPNGGVDELVRKIGAQLGAVEEVTDIGAAFKGVVIAEIVDKKDHPSADKLAIYQAATGEGEPVQVVSGDTNLQVGDKVAWIPPGATVPSTYGKEPFVMESRPLRGEISHGMFGSGDELLINDNHDFVVVLDTDAAPGTSFADAYKLNDFIIDIENKMFTHRPDCFGQLGVAREIAGIQQKAFQSPAWYLDFDASALKPEAEMLPLQIKNELPGLVPRFSAIAMSDIQVNPSPIWLQTYLSRVGIRPINNVVDLTNYFMVLTGQPLHAYDYDKLKALDGGDQANIVVRHPRKDEKKITLLGNKEVQPRAEAVMIACATKAIGIGGIMGGAETEVDEHTKNIVLECASFDLYSIRRTSMEHGLFTDAATRFTKGQSPLQTDRVLAKVVHYIKQFANGQIAGEFIDIKNDLPKPAKVEVSATFINARLGSDLSAADMAELLKNVEFDVTQQDGTLHITAPFWRTDIEIAEDIVEEIGRLYGYDRLPVVLPKRSISPAPRNHGIDFRARLRDVLSAAGANEVLTYNFVHGDLLTKVGQDPEQAFQISSALSPDLQYFRMSLTPGLLEKVHPNIKAGYNQFGLYEMGKAHIRGHDDDEGLPQEFERLAFVFAADQKAALSYAGAPFYQARHYLMTLLERLGLAEKVRFEPLDQTDDQAATYYQPGRGATLKVGNDTIGCIGEYKTSVRRALKLPDFCAGFELGLVPLQTHAATQTPYEPIPRFPKVQQDISLRVAHDVSSGQVADLLRTAFAELKQDRYGHLRQLDIFAKDDAGKHITFRITIADHHRTLTAAEVNKLLDDLAARAYQILGAERI